MDATRTSKTPRDTVVRDRRRVCRREFAHARYVTMCLLVCGFGGQISLYASTNSRIGTYRRRAHKPTRTGAAVDVHTSCTNRYARDASRDLNPAAATTVPYCCLVIVYGWRRSAEDTFC